jgi:hypothetical protein
MAIQDSTAVRNARLDAIEVAIGVSPILRIYNGTMPANPAAALAGSTLLAEGTLPSDWWAAASGGTKAKSGTWTLTGQSGAGAGTVGTFFRIYASDGTTCHQQGSFSATGGGGDMTADNASIANAQIVTVSTFTRTAGNA